MRIGLLLLGVAIVLLAFVETVLLFASPQPIGVLLMFPATSLVYVGVGASAWVRRPANRMGPLFVAAGLVWMVAGLNNTEVAPLIAVGQIVATVPVAVVLHALLAFPSGRLHGPAAHLLVITGYLTTTVLQAPLYVFGRPEAGLASPMMLVERPDLVAVARPVQAVTAAALILLTSVMLIRRLVGERDRARRRVLAPLYLFGVFAIVVVIGIKNLGRLYDLPPLSVPVVQIAILAGVPVAFLGAMLRGGFARTAEIDELGAWLGSQESTRGDLGAALARTLGDPSAVLLYRVESGANRPDYWVGRDGAPVAETDDTRSRTVPVELDDRQIAAIRYDGELIGDPEEVLAIGRVAAIAIGHEQLTAQLLATREQLLDSRTRLLEAGEHERRRLAHDLHDRLQSRLVVLGMQVGGMLARSGDTADPALAHLRTGLDEAITELRSLVQGVMPPLLIERGLYEALSAMADRCPIPVEVHVEGDAAPGCPPLSRPPPIWSSPKR